MSTPWTADVTSTAKVHDLYMYARNIIDMHKHIQQFLLPLELRLAGLFFFAKIYKPGSLGSPLASSNNSPTENIQFSQYVDHFLQPLVQRQPGIPQDTP